MTGVDDAFVRETSMNARELSNAIIAIERDPDQETVDEAFRVAHTLKGNCGAAGLQDASDLAHAVEDVLEAIRQGSLDPSPEVIDDALAAIDDLEAVVKAAGRGDDPAVDVDARVEALREELDRPGIDVGADAADADAGEDTDAGARDPAEADIEFPDMPTEGQDISAEEALDRASVFDDIDQLMEEMDDEAEEFADLGSAGTFDQLDEPADEPAAPDAASGADSGPGPDPESGPGSGSETAGGGDTGAEAEAGGDEPTSLDQSGNVNDVFAEIKSEVDGEEETVDTLQSEIEEVEFGEFDDDDDMTIQELIGDDGGAADAGVDEPAVVDATADADVDGVEVDDPGEVAVDEPPTADAAEADAGPLDHAATGGPDEATVDELVAAAEADDPADPDAEPGPSLDLGDVPVDADEPTAGGPDAAGEPEPEPAPETAPTPRALDADATPAVTEAPVAPRSVEGGEPAVAESVVPRSLDPDATPAVAESVVPRSPGEGEPAVVERAEPAAIEGGEPAVVEADGPIEPTSPRGVEGGEPAVVPVTDEPAAEPRGVEGGEPAVVPVTDEPAAEPRGVEGGEPAVVEAPEPRTSDADATPAVTATPAEPREVGSGEPAVVEADEAIEPVEPAEPRAVEGGEPAVSPAEAAVEPVGTAPPAEDPGGPAAAAAGAGADGDGVGDASGFDWGGEVAEADDDGPIGFEDGDAVEAGATEATDATDEPGAGVEPSDVPSLDEVIEDDEPSVADADLDEDLEAPDLDEDLEAPDLDEDLEAPDLDAEFDTDLDLDLDEGIDLDEGVEAAGGADLDLDAGAGDDGAASELPDLDLGTDTGSEFDVEFGDEETAAFESRFATAFDEAEEAAAAGAAAATARSASTIEDADVDLDALGLAADADADADAPGAGPDPGRGTADRGGDVQTLTVDVENADELLTLAETLTVSRLRLEDAVAPDNDEAEAALSELASVASDFRRTVMDIRLMPLRTVTDTLPRVVRDVARREDKDVEFVTEGTDVRLDRSVIDRIGDPLVHLVRNAVDHGVESPEAREAAGKDPTGTVAVRAERRRDGVVIEVEDDGAGIDADAVRAGAVEDDVLTVEEAESMTDEAVYDLLFRAGFSTASEVTEVSGRGVGMDVVDRALTELDGDVDIDSEPGAGTTVRLTVPVSVAMANVWLVDSGGETFAVPADAVEQIEDPRGAERVDGREMFAGGSVGLADGGEVGDVGGVGDVGDAGAGGVGAGADADADAANEPVPLVRLREAFDTPGERSDGGMVLRLRDEVRPLAIHVDRVVDQQEVVVKPYGELLGSIPGVSGATLRGDGRLVNVVDVQSIDG